MKSTDIRKKFFDFFVRNGHQQVASSSLIPAQDPTILFTNAGMNQFKDLFLGKETRSYKRAVTIQKCVRAGGKHNDLDNVGFTKRHLTFFEMMGNFSFGDYFKREAIRFAWDFLTKEVGLDPQKLYITIYQDDEEAFNIWHQEIGVPANRIFRLGEADNFWSMGDTGPCGPCTEILYDRGAHTSEKGVEGDPTSCGERYMEIWNNVFMQYDRQPDGTLKPLTQTGVDTGMGLERLSSVMQGTDSVYETDLFMPIIEGIEKLTGLQYAQQPYLIKSAFRVLADHIRSSCLLIADGCMPSNEGRGYVLRKIIRRAALFERKLSKKSIFVELADHFIEFMGPIYPELAVHRQLIKKVLATEVEKFAHNLERGLGILDTYFAQNTTHRKIIGSQAFKLYDTFGFPLEITQVIAHERGFTVDREGFEEYMAQQRAQSGQKTTSQELTVNLLSTITTAFTGYTQLQATSPITALVMNNQLVQEAPAGSIVWVVTQQSPFYVECGGQINDTGTITHQQESTELLDLKKIDQAIAMKIVAPSNLHMGDMITMSVDENIRLATMKNHTATHLLQAALISLFGKQIKQAGSIVTPDYLRFDFNYHENLTTEQIAAVETIVNQKIWENIPLSIANKTLQQAQQDGVIAFFGEKYNPENVRVVAIPGFSAELCGGTHVRATGDIGSFKITEVSALSAGTRRIVAVTGPAALELFQQSFGDIKKLSQEFKVKPQDVVQAIAAQQKNLKQLHDELKDTKKKLYQLYIPQWLNSEQTIKGMPVVAIHSNELAPEDLRDITQLMLSKKAGIYCLLTTTAEKTFYVVAASKEFAGKLPLKEMAQWLNTTYNLKGGGTAENIQGGGLPLGSNIAPQILQWIAAH